jgi:hypothetical protein
MCAAIVKKRIERALGLNYGRDRMAIERRSDSGKGRRIRVGMVGGGEGAFISAVHRVASRLDDHYEVVAGRDALDAGQGAPLGRSARSRGRPHLRQL